MKTLRALFLRFIGLLPNRDRHRDLTAEIESNLQLHVDDNVRRGMTPQEARRQAILKLGSFEAVREAYRDRATLPVLENLFRDTRFALRHLNRNPGFTCTAVLTLALGFCASVSTFAFVDAALLKPLPYKDPKRLVGVYEKIDNTCPLCNLSYLDYLDWKHSNTVFTSLDVYRPQPFIMSTSSGVQRAFGARVTDGFFHTLGVTPILGRDFRPGEDLLSAPRTAILSYSAWQKYYAGSPAVLGKSVILDGAANTIVGVLPAEFHFAPAETAEYWTTLHPASECDLRRSCHNLDGLARLKDGVSIPSALADVTGIAERLQHQYPVDNKGQGAAIAPLSEVIVGHIRPILLVLLSGACLLLLIAAVNVVSLLLVRTESRQREIAVRGSLGASPARIVVQFAAEALVLVVTGTVLGLAAACLTMRLLINLIPADMLRGMPYLNNLTLNPRVLTFAATIALLAATLFAFTPLLRIAFSTTSGGLADGSRGSARTTWRRLGSRLVVLELATAVVLLSGAGLLGQSLYRLLNVQIGLKPDHLVLTYVAAPDARYLHDEQNIALQQTITSTISAIPGVQSVGITSDAPIGYNGDTTWFKILGRPWHGEHNDTPERDVNPEYFKTLGATLLRGRFFNEAEDGTKPHVAIVNQAFARHYFPGEDPLGKKLSPLADPPVPIEIVGLLQNIKEGPLDLDTVPVIYFPFNQAASHDFNLLVRTTQSETSILPAITEAVHKIDAGIVTSPGQTMTERINDSSSAYIHRSVMSLVTGFAALALLLGVVGLYGVIAYSVSQRTREIGVRMALGAERANISRLILKEAGWLTAAGIVIGLIFAVGAATLMRGLLFGVTSWDIPTLASVAVILGVSALLASFIPARRAASVSPLDALRAE